MAEIDTRMKTKGASDYDFNLEKMYANVPSSNFQLGFENLFSMDIGQIIPFMCKWTFPQSSYDINAETLVKAVNVPKVATMANMKMYLYVFWCSMTQLWSKWQLFFTKGHNHDQKLLIPKQNYEHTTKLISSNYADVREGSLTDYLNIPYANTSEDLETSKTKAPLSLLKYMMYLKIYRDYFMNEEYHLNSKCWYPDEDEEFRLHGTDYNNPDWTIETEKSKYNETDIPETGDCFKNLGMFEIKYRDFGVDYFSACKMKPTRGPVPTLQYEESGGVPVGVINELNEFKEMGGFLYKDNEKYGLYTNKSDSRIAEKGFNPGALAENKGYKKLQTSNDFQNSIKITIDKLVELQEEQMEMWKIARTDNTYGSEMETFWGIKPRSANTYMPQFVGGTNTPIIFSEVIQQSESTGNSPLGKLGGHAFGSERMGNLGHIDTDDYGMLMGVACIIPEVYYDNGMERTDLWNVQEDIYIPERSVLPPMAVLNAELKYTDDEEYNTMAWGYTDSFDNLRMSQNQVHGLLRDDTKLSFAPYAPKRKMDKKPLHNAEWGECNNTNYSTCWKSAENEIPFVVQIKLDIKARLPLPYRGTPKGLAM